MFKQPQHLILLLGHLTLLTLLALAAWFAEERVLLMDSAYQLFHDINHESMLINDNRFSMVLSQLLPWVLIKLHVPLRWLIVAYSLSFMLICYGCYLLTAHVLNNKSAAGVMTLTMLGVCATFFHCISETFQLMFYAPLFYALAQYDSGNVRWKSILRWVGLVLSETLAFFIHPVALFFIVYLIGYRMIDGRRLRIDTTTVVTTVTLGVLLAVKMLAGTSGHDDSFMPTGETIRYALTHFFSLPSFEYFRKEFLIYLFPIVLWLLTLVGYARQRLWLKAVFVGLYVLGFFVLSVVVYWKGDGPIGMERTYLPLFFFMGLPFFVDELPRLKGWLKWTVFGYFTVMLTLAFISLGRECPHYVDRLQEVKHIAEYAREKGQHKLIVTESTADQLFPFRMWGMALESMLYTARDGADQTVTLYIEEDDFDRSNADLYQNPDVYVSVNWWKRWEVKELNPHYFHLSSQGYMELVKTEKGYEIAPL